MNCDGYGWMEEMKVGAQGGYVGCLEECDDVGGEWKAFDVACGRVVPDM